MVTNVTDTSEQQEGGKGQTVTDRVTNDKKTAAQSNCEARIGASHEPRGNGDIDELDDAVVLKKCGEHHVNHTICGHKRVHRVLQRPRGDVCYDEEWREKIRRTHCAM